MMLTRLTRLFSAVLVCSLLVPATALAAGPQTSPKAIKHIGFESASDNLTISPIVLASEPHPAAMWGRITQSRRTGSYGLWCAGAVAQTGALSAFWPYYPVLVSRNDAGATRGSGTLSVPSLADYYRPYVSFYYIMPSRGGADDAALSLRWTDDPEALFPEVKWDFPLTASWRKVTFDMSAGVRSKLSRKPGTLTFQFYDFIEGGSQRPNNGQGATIDDVTVSGYRYGPVRSLAAAPASARSVRLTWRKPATSVSNSRDDSRAKSYRIWRYDVAARKWVELTAARRVSDPAGSSVSYTDRTPTAGRTYTYHVQTWAASGTSAWGVPARGVSIRAR